MHSHAPELSRRLRTVDELAAELGIHRNTIHRLVASGELKAVRVGRRLRFRPADVDAYLERGSP